MLGSMGDSGLCYSLNSSPPWCFLGKPDKLKPQPDCILGLCPGALSPEALRKAARRQFFPAVEGLQSRAGSAKFVGMIIHECVAHCPFGGGTGLWGCELHPFLFGVR